jgi:hypothetical protein
MESSVGDQINSNKWTQCCFLPTIEIQKEVGLQLDSKDGLLIVVSQSCDLVHYKLDDEPYVECIECHPIEKMDGNYTHGKNPRRLHIPVVRENDQEQIVEIRPYRIHRFDRNVLCRIYPDNKYYLSEKSCRILSRWLASRYAREAFPDEFIRRLYAVKKKMEKKASQLADTVTGIYMQINPDREIGEQENYSVNLLALVEADSEDNAQDVEVLMQEYAELMRGELMDVRFKVMPEDKVSVFLMRSYKKIDWDHITLRGHEATAMPLDL